MKITIDVPDEMESLLEVVSGDSAARTVQELALRAAEGVVRPGCWERPWLEQVFGCAWTAELEQDPEVHWHQRPRRR